MRLSLCFSLLAAAVATATLDEGSDRALHDIRKHNIRSGAKPKSPRQDMGGYQTEPCLLLERIQETPEGPVSTWHCELKGELDVESAGYQGTSAIVDIEGIGFIYEEYDGELVSGSTMILAEGAEIAHHTLFINEDTPITFSAAHHRRKLKSSLGTKSVLIVRVTTSDGKTPEPSLATMSDKVFGTDGDEVNTKSVFEGCSHGKMQIVPATGNGVVNGAMELTSSADSTGGEFPIYNDVLSKLRSHFAVDDLDTAFDFILIAIPDNIMSGAWAFPQTPYSIYGDPTIIYPTFTVHEMGHNLNLDHADEGTVQHGDHQGMMGYVMDHDEGTAAKLCYNPAKNWFIGWYSDRLKEVKPQLAEYSGKLIGVGNYDKISGSDQIVLKIAGPQGEPDYYIGYNHASGWNVGTHESINEVTVVKQKPGLEVSNKVASLKQGQEYKILNYLNLGKDVTIKVNEIDANQQSGFAAVQICFGECGSAPGPVPTQAPVNSPTPAPVNSGGGCVDDQDWVDSDEWTCQDYREHDVCDDEGEWVVDGVGANDVCCHCMGQGTPVSSGGGDDDCTDNSVWVDSDNWTCADYQLSGVCDDDREWEVDGVSANDVCCFCMS